MKVTLEEKQKIQQNLTHFVYHMAGEIAERNFWYISELNACADFIAENFQKLGYEVNCQEFFVYDKSMRNIEARFKDEDSSIPMIILGAHYDSVRGSPGADDNATGVAALLELARLLENKKCSHSIRFVAFANEEPPFFYTRKMGSWVYAKSLRQQRKKVNAMFSLESLGYYSEEKDSQQYPPFFKWFYPDQGNFIALVTRWSDTKLLKQVSQLFRRHSDFPIESVAVPALIPGVSWSDHWAFWKMGFPALMVTDTAFYRNPYYHTVNDSADKINFQRLADLVVALAEVIFLFKN